MVVSPTFQIGLDYSRRQDIHEKFGGNRQSGIAASSLVPAIFLFTGESGLKFGYRDSPDASDYCDYTGEGQVGDMSFTAGNRAVLDHVKDGKALHLFKSLGKGKLCTYQGEFSLAGFSWDQGLDRLGNLRRIIVFHLTRVPAALELKQSSESLPPIQATPLTLESARRLAIEASVAPEGVDGVLAIRSVYQRSERVRRYALMRAKGVCEACLEPAPFSRPDGDPYLEVHHTQRVSDGGIDHPRNVAAVCPTCHRRIHFGSDGDRLNESLAKRIRETES